MFSGFLRPPGSVFLRPWKLCSSSRAVRWTRLGVSPAPAALARAHGEMQAIRLRHFPGGRPWLLTVPQPPRIILPLVLRPQCPLGVSECDPQEWDFLVGDPRRLKSCIFIHPSMHPPLHLIPVLWPGRNGSEFTRSERPAHPRRGWKHWAWVTDSLHLHGHSTSPDSCLCPRKVQVVQLVLLSPGYLCHSPKNWRRLAPGPPTGPIHRAPGVTLVKG